ADFMSRNPLEPSPSHKSESTFLNKCQVTKETEDPELDRTIIVNAQKEDPELRDIRNSLETDPENSPYTEYKIQEDILYRANLDPHSRSWKVCIPKSTRKLVMQNVHDSP